jgi:ABC-2 type transport system permease protein
VFYYFAGYELYFSVFLAIDSLCNTLKEAQAMIMIQLAPLAMMVFVVRNPDSTIVRIMSWLPLFTPYLMMNRAAADPLLIDVVGTTIVLLLSIILVLWLSGKVFRMGMLRTGQPPRLIELLRMMRQGD